MNRTTLLFPTQKKILKKWSNSFFIEIEAIPLNRNSRILREFFYYFYP